MTYVNSTDYPVCPTCKAQGDLTFKATFAAPGHGQVWRCGCGHEFVRIGSMWIDPDDVPPDEEPPWVLSPEDVY